MPPYVKVVPVDYPGHGRRFGQTPLPAIDQIAWVLAREIVADLDGPFALFGHSMGALVAFELTRELRRRRAQLPMKIYASASRPPVSLQFGARGSHLSVLPDHELRGRLTDLGGTPKELLDNAELMELLLPIVRADLAACENYVYRQEPPLPCPITALGGADDRTFDQAELPRWREVTAGSFEAVTMPGDHFFIRSHCDQLTKWLGTDIRKMIENHF
ncbi:thioesterase [Mycobacterium asiaticum]|uniref:Thioesterase TesA n=1 Tax=Mycobacterium asiaticum TaxID=1790 RepID=A0A1A3MY63_MYCAS|nr:thioesterase [Mycobacterium asiaticum]